MTRYNHAFSLAFEVISSKEDGSDVTQEQLALAIRKRVSNLIDNNEMLEAVGPPFDTFEDTKPSEYAFDIELRAVARVMACSLDEAKSKMASIIDCTDVGFEQDGVKITEASLMSDDPQVFEIDGKEA